MQSTPSRSPRVRRILAAQGKLECDLVLKNVQIFDVFSCVFYPGSISIIDGVIVGVDEPLPCRRTVDLQGMSVVPGFIDAHVHVESSLLTPRAFQGAVLKRGTTTAVADPHELANVLGTAGIEYFLREAETLSLDLRVMVSSCVPATTFETNGGGTLSATDIAPFASHPKALGLAEVMNVPAVLGADPDMMAKLEAFAHKPIDGHCPLVRGQALSACAAAGISSCHESSEQDEAREKLRKGIAVWMREGSVAKDLSTLAPLLTMATSSSMGFCTDDRNPLDIQEEGHLDHLIRKAIAHGVDPGVAYRTASWSVARHYGLASNIVDRVGAIAPGYRADLVVLGDVNSCNIHSVYKSGVRTDELAQGQAQESFVNTIQATAPERADLEGPKGQVHVIGVEPGKIITTRTVLPHDASGVMRISVLERYGHGSKPANAYVRGFGELRGAIASSVGHDSHNLIVVGKETADMQAALAAVIAMHGGFVVVSEGQVVAELALPFGGLMTSASEADIAKALTKLRAASQSIGCELHEPFLQLAFLSLPVIPSLKLTDKGLMDVDKFELISVRAA
jgi:adenine deaminase